MTSGAIKIHVCDCGQMLIFGQPDQREVLTKLVQKAGPGASLILLSDALAICPACGKAYELPPAEILDLDRSEFGRLLSDLDAAQDDK